MSSKTQVKAKNTPSLVKGLVAGCIGGLAGVLAMTFAERMFPPQGHDALLPEPGAEPAAAETLAPAAKAAPSDSTRWVFGAAAGAAYGGLVEYVPAAAAKDGAGLGLALGVLTQETTLSALTGSTKPTDTAGKFPPLVVYGLTAEFVRKWLRKAL